jgi:hypothetical protein
VAGPREIFAIGAGEIGEEILGSHDFVLSEGGEGLLADAGDVFEFHEISLPFDCAQGYSYLAKKGANDMARSATVATAVITVQIFLCFLVRVII